MLEGAGSWYLVPIWEPEQTPKPPRHFSAHLAPSHAVFLYSSRPSEALTTVGGPLVLIGQTRDWLKTGIWPWNSWRYSVIRTGFRIRGTGLGYIGSLRNAAVVGFRGDRAQ
jgi:hypothetical protein